MRALLKGGLILSLILGGATLLNAQVIGGRENGQQLPTTVKRAELSGGNYSGNVNLFNGTYGSSYSLGSVSTPSGLSYSLSLNYSTSFAGGNNIPVATGIPYGEGWDLSLPTISVSYDEYKTYTEQFLYNHGQNSQSQDNLHFNNNEGKSHWFAPFISIPGVASGRAVFKKLTNGDNYPVFVLQNFEKYVELVFTGTSWEVTLDDGTKYTFDISQATFRNASNKRNFPYETSLLAETMTYAEAEILKNLILPKGEILSWYCSGISHSNHPVGQTIRFEYKTYGRFNYFKEFMQPLLKEGIKQTFPELPLFINTDFEIFSDILLTSVYATEHAMIFQQIELDYETTEPTGGTDMLLRSQPDVHTYDDLYNYKSIYYQGTYDQNSGTYKPLSTNASHQFENWNRYLHVKADELAASDIQINNPQNPYIDAFNNCYRTQRVSDVNEVPFNHGFLESERISDVPGNRKIVAGDIYEIRSVVNSGRFLNLDINIATGTNTVDPPNSETPSKYSLANYSRCGETVFTTFNQAVKWNTRANGSNYVVTSNYFSMPNLPNKFEGFNIQIGPANSDGNFSLEPFQAFLGKDPGNYPYSNNPPSAYNSYMAFQQIVNNQSIIKSTDAVSRNFGIGLPWHMMRYVYQYMNPFNGVGENADMFRFWWNFPESQQINPNLNWKNVPTAADYDSYLKAVELIRYSKNPYMLRRVNTYKYKGDPANPIGTPKTLISRVELNYETLQDEIADNLNYQEGEMLKPSQKYRTVFTLKNIKTIPVDPAGNNDGFTYDLAKIPTTHFEYNKLAYYHDLWVDKVYTLGGSVVLEKITNHLGGITLIDYYGMDSPFTHLSPKYKTPQLYTNPPASNPDMGKPLAIQFQNVVKTITIKGSEDDQAKTTEYLYYQKTSSNDVPLLDPNHFTNSNYKVEAGFRQTVVRQPALETGEKPYTVYFHKGKESSVDFNQDKLYFGKLYKVETYDHFNNFMLSKTETNFEADVAYQNGILRPSYKSHTYPYDYYDYHESIEPSGSLGHKLDIQVSMFDNPSFYEFYYPQTLSENYLNSFFVKKTNETSTEYESNTCIKPASTVLPGGGKESNFNEAESFINNTQHANKVVLLALIAESLNIESTEKELIKNSPLFDEILHTLIEKHYAAQSSMVKKVLLEQKRLSDPVLAKYARSVQINKHELYEELLLKQGQLTDEILLILLENKELINSKKLASVLLKQESLSSAVLFKVLRREPALTPKDLQAILSKQQLPTDILLEFIGEATAIKNPFMEEVLLGQKQLSNTVLIALIDKQPTVKDETLKKVILGNVFHPSDEVLLALLNRAISVQPTKLFEIFDAQPYLSPELVKAIEAKIYLFPRKLITAMLLKPRNGNPYSRYCNNDNIEGTLKIQTVSEYKYYEAGFNGYTQSDAYKRLMGLDKPSFALNYEPSWQLYSVKSYSPQMPGAFTKEEYFYYYDLKNQYHRHLKTLDCDKFCCDCKPILDEVGKVYALPEIDGLVKSHEHQMRNIPFQKTIISKNGVDLLPIEKSEYYLYEARWNNLDEMPTELINILGEECGTGNTGESGDDGTGEGGTGDGGTTGGTTGGTEGEITNEAVAVKRTENANDNNTSVPSTKRMSDITALSKCVFPRSIYVQIDNIPDPEYPGLNSLVTNNGILDFYHESTDENGRKHYAPRFPYDALRTKHVYRRTRHGLVEIEEDVKGLKTKYHYDNGKQRYYYDENCVENIGIGLYIENPGLPSAITVGHETETPLTTSYAFYDDQSIKTITDPNGVELKYEYDEFGRMNKSYRNGDLLEMVKYHTWENSASSFAARASENYIDASVFLDAGSNRALRTLAYMDPLGRAYNTATQPVSNSTSMVHTGKVVYDNWDRPLETFKPFIYTNGGAAVNFTPRFNAANETNRMRQAYENNPRSRPLKEAKPGEDLAGNKTVKYRYEFVNYLCMVCDLGLSLDETNLLMPGSKPEHVFRKTEIEDEDGKISIEYTNALGQKVATKQNLGNFSYALTLYGYDSYGNLTRVINPEKQESHYRYNMLGWLYEKQTVDGGKTRYMYNKSGQVVLEQDANGEAGALHAQTNENTPYYRRFSYDNFGRMVSQEKAPYKKLFSYTPFINILNYKTDQLHTLEGGEVVYWDYAENKPAPYFEYHFSNNSTYDWMADISIIKPIQSGPGLHYLPVNTSALEFLDAYQTYEKRWFYDESTAKVNVSGIPSAYLHNNTKTFMDGTRKLKGKLSHAITYDNEVLGAYPYPQVDPYKQKAVKYDFFAYNADGNIEHLIQQFNPNKISDVEKGIVVSIQYPEYNLQGNLVTENIDVNNDNILDMQYHYAYDEWNRLEKVYANFDNSKADGNLMAAYSYDDANGLITKTEYFKDLNDCPRVDNAAIDVITYTYDIRDRLTDIQSRFMDYKLYYNSNLPQYGALNMMADNNYNGNINGIKVSYKLNSAVNDPADLAAAGNPTRFAGATYYGYKYDGLNRLIKADGLVEDAGTGLPVNAPAFTYGDEEYTYDKIGNILTLKRHLAIDPANPVINPEAWGYRYTTGTNKLYMVRGIMGTADRNYTYDAAGNLLTDDHRKVNQTIYGRANLPYELNVNGDAVNYLYDLSDTRIFKYNVKTGGESLIETKEFYLHNAGGKEIGILDMVNGSWTWYAFGRERFAKINPEPDQQPAYSLNMEAPESENILTFHTNTTLGDVSYYIHDHLGNTRVTYTPKVACKLNEDKTYSADVSYTLDGVFDYYPYGKILRQYVAGEEEKYLTTQHQRDEETGLDYRGARYYDSDIGRFLSLDALAINYLSLSSFCYVAGNPVAFVDPDGKVIMFASTISEDGQKLIMAAFKSISADITNNFGVVAFDKQTAADAQAFVDRIKNSTQPVGTAELAQAKLFEMMLSTDTYVIQQGDPDPVQIDPKSFEIVDFDKNLNIDWENQAITVDAALLQAAEENWTQQASPDFVRNAGKNLLNDLTKNARNDKSYLTKDSPGRKMEPLDNQPPSVDTKAQKRREKQDERFKSKPRYQDKIKGRHINK